MTPPKVFLSHATEDKSRFVDNFALRLRLNHIDVWFDKWKLLPGDSLVDKIFNEGLKEAEIIIIILSSISVSKPWVLEELCSSIVAKIQKGTRIIPVIIDQCEVPEVLKTIVWECIDDISNYDDSFERILAAILGKSIEPPLGQPPAYVSAVLNNIDGIEAIDNLVLKKSCEFLLENSSDQINPQDLFGENNAEAPPKLETIDSIKILEEKGYFSVCRLVGSPEWGCHYQVTLFGFEEYCKAYMPDYGQIVDQCAGLIVNNKASTNFELRDSLGIPLIIASHVILILENNNLVRLSKTRMRERILIIDVSAKLRRKLR